MPNNSHIIVDKIIKDICGRTGLGNEWDEIDSETQIEIKLTWQRIIEDNVS